MKFARYLQDAQTPEWKKAYIDYQGLKKCISAIRKSQEEHAAHFSRTDSPPMRPQNRFSVNSTTSKNALGLIPMAHSTAHGMYSGPYSQPQLNDGPVISIQRPEEAFLHFGPAPQTPDWVPTSDRGIEGIPLEAYASPSEAFTAAADLNNNDPNRSPQKQWRRSFFQQNLKAPKRRRHLSIVSHWSAPRGGANGPVEALPLSELYRLLTPQEHQFFIMLDEELQKVDSFYATKESQLQVRTQRLSEQLKELGNHKRVVITTRPSPRWAHVVGASLWHKSNPPEEGTKYSGDSTTVREVSQYQEENGIDSLRDSEPAGGRAIKHSNDMEDYLGAKRKLQKAIVEHYRGAETLVNYRILNVTGFRKALKKFEKVTKIPVQEQYIAEKVEKSSLWSDRAVQRMMEDMERLYAEAFARNNMKKAREDLRGGGRRVTSHHFSAFRSGLYLGMALLLIISVLYRLSKPEIRNEMPHWDSILHVYGILFFPAIFPILISLNIFVWSSFRINYVFIFELDTRTLLDHHKYFELPSLFFVTFCLAMWLSFSGLQNVHVNPNTWPLAWLGLVAFILFNPFRLWFKETRYWFLKLLGQLFLSGTRRVEFSDFWLADQLCSFNYTLSGFAYIACAYTVRFDGDNEKCSYQSYIWPVQWVLTSLPLFIRLVQCFKRYVDSGMRMHVLNAARYANGIIGIMLFNLWKQSGSTSGLLAVWCMINTSYSLYSCIWDAHMDWSMFGLNSKYPPLRNDLVYVNHVYVYYIALILNVILRFGWVLYIPQSVPNWDPRLCSFVVGFLEVLRRILWNFFRLENEHLGNVDQYRITREVPLPYDFDKGQQLGMLDDEKLN